MGLCGLTMALLCDCALQLGGRHLHWLIHLVVKGSSATAAKIADNTIATLYRNGFRLELIQRLDVLFLDEIGQWLDKDIAVIDIVLRKVQHSMRFMASILLFGTQDLLQLLPIDRRPPMLSPHMISSFKFSRLHQSVRATLDLPFEQLQKNNKNVTIRANT